MTAREELAQSIATNLDRMFGTREFGPATQDYALADALLAEGWGNRRTVATVEELDALPVGSIVQDAFAVACQRTNKFINHQWERIGHVHPTRPYLPADVLWEPQP